MLVGLPAVLEIVHLPIMRPMRTLWRRQFLVALSALLLVAACTKGTPPPDPQPILEGSFAAMKAQESFHFEIRIESPATTNTSQGDRAFLSRAEGKCTSGAEQNCTTERRSMSIKVSWSA